MNQGECSQEEIQTWVANRFYYQAKIPIKDAFILTKSDQIEFRHTWRQRIIDHDGNPQLSDGGIEAWLILGEACGVAREDLLSFEYVLPGVRFAVDAYCNFVKEAPLHEAVCSSLTELFAPKIHQDRLANWPSHYKFVKAEGYAYFKKRLREARRDVVFGLDYVLDNFQGLKMQNRALQVVKIKLDILWSLADSIYLATVLKMPPYQHLAYYP